MVTTSSSAVDAQKIAKFEPNDPLVVQLARNLSSTLSLQALIREHYNSGKRTGQLRPRVVLCDTDEEEVPVMAAANG